MLPFEVRRVDRFTVIGGNRGAPAVELGFLAIVLQGYADLLASGRTLPKALLLLHQVIEKKGRVEIDVDGFAIFQHEIVVGDCFELFESERHFALLWGRVSHHAPIPLIRSRRLASTDVTPPY